MNAASVNLFGQLIACQGPWKRYTRQTIDAARIVLVWHDETSFTRRTPSRVSNHASEKSFTPVENHLVVSALQDMLRAMFFRI